MKIHTNSSPETVNEANTHYGTSPLVAKPIPKAKRVRRSPEALDSLLETCKEIIGSYEEQITIRHLFYRLVGLRVIEKEEASYRLLCSHLSKWRKSGHLPFDAFIDGTRWHYGTTTFTDAEDALHDTVRSYRKNLWQSQNVYPEVWAEKDAIASIITPIASEWGVKVFISRGVASISSLYKAGQTFEAMRSYGKEPRILYFGDHDPSGLGIDAAIKKSFTEFGQTPPIFKRLAVTKQQITDLALPTRPVKKTDKRAKNWEGGCVEVDTLTPVQIRDILEKKLISLIDAREWNRTKYIEEAERESLAAIRL